MAIEEKPRPVKIRKAKARQVKEGKKHVSRKDFEKPGKKKKKTAINQKGGQSSRKAVGNPKGRGGV